jgi:2-hydroxychromene-2-carboxylate isomerase
MSLSVDLFWSFRSPYSYLATPRLVTLEQDYDLTINVRPVYPIAVRNPDFFEQVNPLWVPYLLRDTQRVAEQLNLPFHWPKPDPIVQDMATRRIASEQPYIHRLTRLGIAAVRRDKGLAFLDEMSRLIFGGIENWHEGDHMAEATARAGLDLAEMDAAIAADPTGHEAEIEANQRALHDAGHWGVPTLAFEGEPFFGQDRIDLCLWRMEQKGLHRRT